ncbi:cyclin-dependent kinase inhibitor 1 isoform X1 [Xiphophorus hellerii]|uniref:cyclin-dependent kinase inhibitor 1 isoform X1 n=2 Tax=Xiphophorus hellerii TaxID=8084 RepID=UPI0013B4463F|nr:cyclin-dependent kinase inhibitor 1-like isoform X1 [Xiphophorus hellerii]
MSSRLCPGMYRAGERRGGESLTAACLVKSSAAVRLLLHTGGVKQGRKMCRIMAPHKPMLSSLGGNRRVRRNLFGPVDRDQLQVEYQAALRKDLDEASKRWGFDFNSYKPLESSDFTWEGIPETRVPLLYRSCVPAEGLGPAGGAVPTKPARVEKENILQTPVKWKLQDLKKTPAKGDKAALKRKQTNITDFYQAKRRVVWKPRKSGE